MKRLCFCLVALLLTALSISAQVDVSRQDLMSDPVFAFSQPVASRPQMPDLSGLRDTVRTLRREVEQLQSELRQAVEGLHQALDEQKRDYSERMDLSEAQIQKQKADTDYRIEKAGEEQAEETGKVKAFGLISILSVLLLSALWAYLLHRRGKSRIDSLKQESERLNAEIVERLSSEATELSTIASSLSAVSSSTPGREEDHALIRSLADRITFMEMTLFKMDPSVRGYKHLKRSIAQMKDNLAANGYEIVEMLGKPFHEGMKATVSFEDDDTLEPGTRIITNIIKPQINYRGEMIQASQISVSQNI